VKTDWAVASWKENLGVIPVPDFASSFKLTKESKFLR
jgi:hypothetical protein